MYISHVPGFFCEPDTRPYGLRSHDAVHHVLIMHMNPCVHSSLLAPVRRRPSLILSLELYLVPLQGAVPHDPPFVTPTEPLLLLLALGLGLGSPLPLPLGVYLASERVLILEGNEVDGEHPGSQEDAGGPAV